MTTPALPAENSSYIRRDLTVSMTDGTRLHGCRFDLHRGHQKARRGAHPVNNTPLLCIPSELYSLDQYEKLIEALAKTDCPPSRIYSVSLRGRGQSEMGRNADTTTVDDAQDIIDFCDANSLHDIDVLVSGRAVFAVILTAPKRPTLFRRLVLNDAAPEFDNVGIARLATAAKRMPMPKSWDEASQLLQQLNGEAFPIFTDEDWNEQARLHWADKDGTPALGHHKNLIRLSNADDYDIRQPVLWDVFKLFRTHRCLLVRGEHSELVTPEIEQTLVKFLEDGETVTAMGQGHCPALHQDDLPHTIAAFLAAD
ncbi:MAG: alpha/beta hydrolase [Pseudomonadota bacterium]